MSIKCVLSVSLVAASLFLTGLTFAQSNSNPVESGFVAPRMIQTVEPSFRIDPIVHRFRGRRGEVLPFEFTITSLGKPMNLEVVPVNLRQEESGVILHDQETKPSSAVVLTTPAEFEIKAGESRKITGNVTIPMAKTNYLSFGILVRDLGQKPEFEDIQGETSTRAGIRFVTQYVLRVDLETGNADPRAFGKLILQDGKIVAQQGLPMVRAYLDNPTEFAFECQVRAAIDSKTKKKPRPLLLGMPSRSELDGDDRYLVRIMPHSRLRLEAPVDVPVFAGENTLRLGISNGRREVSSADFLLQLAASDFPALETHFAYLGEGMAVSPGQIEVGTVKNSKRTIGMKFVNNTDTDQEVTLAAIDSEGVELTGVKLVPMNFKVRTGRTKGVRVRATTTDGTRVSGLGEIAISAIDEEGIQTQTTIPLMVHREERQAPQISLSDIQLVNHGHRPEFQLTVANQGSLFVPVDANLEIVDAGGRAVSLSAGFGKWIPPGEQRSLRFVPPVGLASGEYLLNLVLSTYDDQPPIAKSISIRLEPEGHATSPKPRSAKKT